MFNIVSNLFFTTAVCFIDRSLHAFGHFISIKDYKPINISGCPCLLFALVIFHFAKNLPYLHPE